jgi:flagellar biosynthetic protein FliR
LAQPCGQPGHVLTFTEAQILAWITPLLWPFLRVRWRCSAAVPVFSQRTVPARVTRLALFIALAAQGRLPPMPVVPLDSPGRFMLVAQQVLIGMSWASRCAWCSRRWKSRVS